MQIFPNVFEIKQFSLHIQNLTNKKEDLDSFKTEHTHFVSSLNKNLETSEGSWLSH